MLLAVKKLNGQFPDVKIIVAVPSHFKELPELTSHETDVKFELMVISGVGAGSGVDDHALLLLAATPDTGDPSATA